MTLVPTLSAAPSVRLLPTEEGALLLDLATDNYYSINHTGEMVWQALKRGEGAEGAAQALHGHYQIPLNEARGFAESFIQQLIKESLISRAQQSV